MKTDGKFHQCGPARWVKVYLPRSVDSLGQFCGDRPIVDGGEGFCFYDDGLLEAHKPPADVSQRKPPAGATVLARLGHLVRRAQNDDDAALKTLVSYTQALCNELEILAQHKPGFVKAVASNLCDWPVRMSLNGPRVEQLTALLKTLGSAAKTHLFLSTRANATIRRTSGIGGPKPTAATSGWTTGSTVERTGRPSRPY